MTGARVIADRFELERLADEGGMGSVWCARDRLTGGRAAVKLLGRANERWAERFRREAIMLANLVHPAIVRYVAHGVTGAAEPWLAMEWLDGESLAVRLRRGRLTIPEVRELGVQIALGLAAAHEQGVIHRDVKPGNVFLERGEPGKARLLDFGVARSRLIESDTTRTGDRVGTPRYMAPEQVRAAHAVDFRCDLWSLGCVIYAALSGKPPFVAADELAIWAKILLEDPPPLLAVRPDVPPALSALVQRLLEKNPAHRPATALAVADELRRLELGDGEGVTGITAIGAVGSSIERRRVAVVMVGDVAGDITLDGKHASGPTEVDASPVFAELAECAARYGGQFEGLAAGAGLVTFAGSPSATDLAARAARCALAVRAIVEAPIAVVSGRGVLGGAGTLGEALERAAELLRASAGGDGAPASAVAIDEVTAGLLGARFAIVRTGLVAWVDHEVTGDEPVRAVLGRRTPTLGRDREVALLYQSVGDAIEQGAARAVLVTGDAGIGKSRLRRELLDRLCGDEPAPRIWLGRGDPVRAGAPFGLVASALRWRSGVPDRPAGGEERDRIGLAIRALCDELAPGDARLAAFACELAGAPLPSIGNPVLAAARLAPRVMADQMRRAWIDLLAHDLGRGPVVIVLDDVHWGDAPSIELLDLALAQAVERPFALCAFARPEVTELFPRLWASRGLTHVRLGPLSRKAATQLCREVLGVVVDEPAIDQLVARASGNPFYLEELMHAAQAGETGALPETVLAMVQVRLEALSPAARRVLRAASVFGAAVPTDALAAVLGDGSREIAPALAELATRELLVAVGDHELHFRHELIRDAAYALLLDSERATAHRAAGAWLEGQREREALVVAQHLERGGERARAAVWYRYAAEQALDADDPRAVLERVARGLACGAAGEERAQLLLLSAYAHDWLADTLATETAAIDAMDAASEGSTIWLRAAAEVTVASARQQNVGLVSSIARHLLRLAHGEDRSAYVIALAHTAAELLVAGRRELARRVVARMDEVAPGCDPYAEGGRLRAHALVAALAGDGARCLLLSLDSVAAFEQVDARRDLVSGLVNVAFGHGEVGQYDDARRTLERALVIADELGVHRTRAVAMQNLALVLLMTGDAARALVLAEDAEALATAQLSSRLAAGAMIYEARALIELGRLTEAIATAERAIAATGEVPPMRAYAHAVVGDAHRRAGDPMRALRSAQQAMTIFDELGGIDEGEHYLRLVLAKAQAAAGDHDGALATARAAVARIAALAEAIADLAMRASFLAIAEIVELHALARAG
ncbi:MAG: protein kinase [Deltaproteobacteria bacterium]|nr:protein kinase [Deltaproteobacteria bacterium]